MDIYSTKEPISNTAYVETEANKNIYVNTQSNGFKTDAFLQEDPILKAKLLNANFKNKSELKRAIILSEILGRPKGY